MTWNVSREALQEFVATMNQALERKWERERRQEEIAALLVARGWAVRDKFDPCSRSIRLRSLNQCTCSRDCRRGNGFLYVTEAGEILSGHTKAEAKRVGPQTRRRMLGEP